MRRYERGYSGLLNRLGDPDPAVRKAAEETYAYLEDRLGDEALLGAGQQTSLKEVPMYAVREMSDTRIVLETRGSRYIGSAIFLSIGILFAAAVMIADGTGFRLFCAALAAASTAASALIFIGKERLVFDVHKGTAEYTNRVRPSKNRIARLDQVALVEVRSDRSLAGPGKRRSTTVYVLELVMVDGRRLVANKSVNESSLRDLATRIEAMRAAA